MPALARTSGRARLGNTSRPPVSGDASLGSEQFLTRCSQEFMPGFSKFTCELAAATTSRQRGLGAIECVM